MEFSRNPNSAKASNSREPEFFRFDPKIPETRARPHIPIKRSISLAPTIIEFIRATSLYYDIYKRDITFFFFDARVNEVKKKKINKVTLVETLDWFERKLILFCNTRKSVDCTAPIKDSRRFRFTVERHYIPPREWSFVINRNSGRVNDYRNGLRAVGHRVGRAGTRSLRVSSSSSRRFNDR